MKKLLVFGFLAFLFSGAKTVYAEEPSDMVMVKDAVLKLMEPYANKSTFSREEITPVLHKFIIVDLCRLFPRLCIIQVPGDPALGETIPIRPVPSFSFATAKLHLPLVFVPDVSPVNLPDGACFKVEMSATPSFRFALSADPELVPCVPPTTEDLLTSVLDDAFAGICCAAGIGASGYIKIDSVTREGAVLMAYEIIRRLRDLGLLDPGLNPPDTGAYDFLSIFEFGTRNLKMPAVLVRDFDPVNMPDGACFSVQMGAAQDFSFGLGPIGVRACPGAP